MSKVGIITPGYNPAQLGRMRIEVIRYLDEWGCDGERVQLPAGVLIPGNYPWVWIVTDRGSELHNECSLLVFGHKNMVSG